MSTESATFSSIGRYKAPASKPFALQYTSLMLIILSFIVGAFVRDNQIVKSEPSQTVVKLPEAPQVPLSIGKMDFSDMFTTNKTALNLPKAKALSAFLMQHDINAHVKIYATLELGEQSSRHEALGLAVARTIHLHQYLTEQGVPSEALNIVAVEHNLSVQQAEINFYKGQVDGF